MQNMFLFSLTKIIVRHGLSQFFSVSAFQWKFWSIIFFKYAISTRTSRENVVTDKYENLYLCNNKINHRAPSASIKLSAKFLTSFVFEFVHTTKTVYILFQRNHKKKKNKININVSSCGYPGNKMCFLFIFCLFYLLKLNRIACACVWAYAPCDAVTQKQ